MRLVTTIACFVAACGSSRVPQPPAVPGPATSPVAATPSAPVTPSAPAAATSTPTAVPITTASPEALAAFQDGSKLLGKRDEAVVAFDRAIALDPTFAQAYWMRARVRVPEGFTPQALPTDHPARADFARAQELATRLSPIERAWIEANIVAALHEPEDDEAERAAFDRLDALAGTITAVQERRLALADRRGDRRTVLDAARKLAEREPTNAERWADVASTHRELDQLDEALAAADRALALAPEDPQILDTRGEVLLARGDLDGAARAFREVIDRKPDAAMATTALAAIQAHRGDWAGARTALESALAKARSPGEKYFIGDALAWVYFADGQLARALAMTVEAGSHGPELGFDPEHGALARAFMVRITGDWKRTLEEADRALALPRVWNIHRAPMVTVKIRALLELGRGAEADALERGLDAISRSPQYQHRSARLQLAHHRALRAGDEAAANAALARLRAFGSAETALADQARFYQRARRADRLAEVCAELRRPTRWMSALATRHRSPCR